METAEFPDDCAPIIAGCSSMLSLHMSFNSFGMALHLFLRDAFHKASLYRSSGLENVPGFLCRDFLFKLHIDRFGMADEDWYADTGRGNPPSLVKLKDGRLAITYGFRDEPYGIRAKLSSDNGETWSDEIVLRDDGGNWDLGYPRTAQRADGKMVTVYYFNNTPSAERYIAGAIWDPGTGSGLAK